MFSCRSSGTMVTFPLRCSDQQGGYASCWFSFFVKWSALFILSTHLCEALGGYLCSSFM